MVETETKEKKQSAGGSKKGLLVFLALIAIVVLGVWFGRDMLGSIGAAAKVNEEVITRAEYNARVEQIERQYELQLSMGGGEGSVEDAETQAQIRNVAIDELVNERLFLQAAGAAGVEISDAEVESELRLQQESYPDEASYKADLAEAGITESELKQNIRNQLTIIAYARSVIPEEEYTVTDEELQEVYDLNFAGAETGVEGVESEVPTFEEFSSANREQFELQKLGVAVGPLIEDLRSNARIEIYVDIPNIETEGQQIQETAPQDITDIPEGGLEQAPVSEEGGTETPEESSPEVEE